MASMKKLLPDRISMLKPRLGTRWIGGVKWLKITLRLFVNLRDILIDVRDVRMLSEFFNKFDSMTKFFK